MTIKNKNECRVKGKGRSLCSATTRTVTLRNEINHSNRKQSSVTNKSAAASRAGAREQGEIVPAEIPEEVTLCDRHNQELNERGILNFFKLYGLDELDWSEGELLQERHMTYLDPGVLEGVASARMPMEASGGYGCVPGYEDLRQTNIDLEEMALTDKQLMAVCLVFYGGIKKKNAARAMKISAQALSDHIKAALKKIKGGLCHSL